MWFGSSNFSTGKSRQQQNKPIEHTVQRSKAEQIARLKLSSVFKTRDLILPAEFMLSL